MSASSIFGHPARTNQQSGSYCVPSRRHRGLALLSWSILLLVMSGCGPLKNWHNNGFKVGPTYGRPAAPVADAWLDAYDQKVRSDLPDYPAWWEVFNDPRLSELVQSTYEQNLTLRKAGMRVIEARAMRGIAVGGLFPQQQSGFGSYSRNQLSTTTAGMGQLIGQGPFAFPRIQPTWSTGFDAYWELDIWGRFRRSIEAADADLDASIEDYDAILVALIAETAATYVDYRTAQQQLAYARANVETQKGSLTIAETKFEHGAANELDAKQALANLKNTEQLVPLFEARIRNANLRLCTLLGTPPRDLTAELGEGPIPVAPVDVAVGVPADLLRRRPDVRAAERRVAAQSARIGVATADLFPHFSITGAIRLDSERFESLFSSASTAGFISPGFNWDVLNYGRLINGVRVQDARFQELAYQYQQTVLLANEEVESAINNFLNAQERLKAATEGVAASQRSVEIVELQYREGVADFNRVYNLQRLLVTDQDRLASTQGELALFLIATYKAIGGGWEIRNGNAANVTVVGPTVVGPTVVGPTVVGPTVAGPTVAGPTVVEPTDVEPTPAAAEAAADPADAAPSPEQALGTETK